MEYRFIHHLKIERVFHTSKNTKTQETTIYFNLTVLGNSGGTAETHSSTWRICRISSFGYTPYIWLCSLAEAMEGTHPTCRRSCFVQIRPYLYFLTSMAFNIILNSPSTWWWQHHSGVILFFYSIFCDRTAQMLSIQSA
ncbi:hypothetical protein XENOCAPTIV_022286 [Xenoophorus captivus]|uniref:Uncharacterized protein n=1 Tax=Xenoophorus captivus TaxID=1517983 RepID=A0ABV0S975_9TELE